MIVSRANRALVLKLRHPERVTTVVPSAKVIPFKGMELVAIPHRPDEVRVLRNLGIQAPAPIEYHYRWSGQYAPFDAQRATAAFLTLNERAFVLNDLGTGKTLATLWAYDYLRSVGAVKKLLVVSPLSTLERTWADEVFRHFPHLTWAVLYGTKSRREKLLREDVDIYLINHDGVRVMQDALQKREGIDVVVIDEIATFRNSQTTRWRSLQKVIKNKKRVWGLTGTPTPNAPTDAYGQAKLISPDRIPKFYTAFRDQVLKQISPFKWVPRPNATEIVAQALQPSIRFAREDCVDLPPCVYQTRHVELTSEQTDAYEQMMKTLRLELESDQILAVNQAVKLLKLVQIASGVVYTQSGENAIIPAGPRVDVVREVIEEAGGKTIVFVPFRGALDHLAEELGKDFTVATISGATPKSQRDIIFDLFQNSEDPRVLVAQPAAMSHGLTLTAANVIVWYAPITSNEVYEQANARIIRPGQTRGQLIVNIEGTPVERRIYQRLQDKTTMQGLLLDIVHGGQTS